jgi:hypothetical protein
METLTPTPFPEVEGLREEGYLYLAPPLPLGEGAGG